MFNFGTVNNKVKLEPLVKWSGSKRKQAPKILEHFPKSFDTYYEPFVGGGSVIGALLVSNIKVKNYVCSDLNGSLIGIYNTVKDNPSLLKENYRELWEGMKSIEDIDGKKEYYNNVRDRYNKERSPLDFFFIMRTVFNGMPRYNSNGEFNNPLHLNRDGIIPSTMDGIIDDWGNLFRKFDVQFLYRDFKEVEPKENDFMYCDPPYEESGAMYFGTFDTEGFYDFLRNVKCSYLVSYDGFRNDEGDSKVSLPKELFTERVFLESGNSSFSRLNGKTNVNVFESLYIKKNDKLGF